MLVKGYFSLVHRSSRCSYFGKNQKIFRKGSINSLVAQHEISVTMMKISLTEQKESGRVRAEGGHIGE